MILYLAGLKAVDPTLLEAVRVDGAFEWQTFWHVVQSETAKYGYVSLPLVLYVCLQNQLIAGLSLGSSKGEQQAWHAGKADR